MSSSASPAPPLLITIRFSTSQPDLDINIASPQTTTVLAFKHNLRNRLSSRNRLRLIYQGRILTDASALSTALKPLPAAPSPSPPPPPTKDDDPKGKGKGKAADLPVPIRVYLNCSIGDELSAEELAEEAAAAEKPPPEDNADDSAAGASSRQQPAWKRPRPKGFDRLLQAGFTQSEIATLRTQFASIHTERFAPDAMPSPDTLRGMEDSWIDSNAGELPSSSSTGTLEDDFSSMSTVLDVLIRGMMIGFFFPLGSMTWLLRQGIWGEKWQVFVGSGAVLSLTVGIFMGMSVDR